MRAIHPDDFEDLIATLNGILPDGADQVEVRAAIVRALAEVGIQAMGQDDLQDHLQERILNALGMASIQEDRVSFDTIDMDPDPDIVRGQDGHWCSIRLFMPTV